MITAAPRRHTLPAALETGLPPRLLALLWTSTAVAAALAGAVLVYEPILLAVLPALALAAALVVGAVAQPRWGLIALLFVLVTFVPEVLETRFGGPKLGYMLLAVIAFAVLARGSLNVERLAVPPVIGLLAALALAMAASSLFAGDLPAALDRVQDFIRDATLVALILLLLDSPRWLARALWAFVLAVGLLALLAVFQQTTGTYGFDYGGFAKVEGLRGLHRSEGPLSANFFGEVLVVAAVYAYYAGLAAGRPLARHVAYACGALSVLAIAFTGSRGAFVALAAGLLLMVVLRRPRFRTVAIGALLVALLLGVLLSSAYRDRIGTLGTSTLTGQVATSSDRSIRSRFSENLAAVQMFADRPILGVGPNQYPLHYLEYSQYIGIDRRPEQRRPHSLYLEALAELGIVGALVFFGVLGAALRSAWRGRRHLTGTYALLAEGAFVGLVAFMVAGLFLHLAYPRYLWIVVGMALLAGRLTMRSVESSETRADAA
jgi:putative inorganic carbon (HCO3(-)) transporter